MNFLDSVLRSAGLNCLAALALGGVLQAGIIDYPPGGAIASLAISADAPNFGASGVYTGVAQSFTAQDSNVSFGFYIQNASSATVSSEPLIFSLYSGDGLFINLLKQQTVAVTGLGAGNTALIEANFAAVTLTKGSVYTVSVSPAAQPTLGNLSELEIPFFVPDPYSGGRVYFTGSTFDESALAVYDFAFRVAPATAPASAAPEPTTLALTGVAFLGLVGTRWGSKKKWLSAGIRRGQQKH